MGGRLAALALAVMVAAQSSAAPAYAQSPAADAKQTFCTLAKWRSDHVIGTLDLIEPAMNSITAQVAKLSVPVTRQHIDFAALRARITGLAGAVCGAATTAAARAAWQALIAGQKDIAAELKTASQRNSEALKAAAQAIKAKTKDRMKDAIAAAKARTKAALDEQKADLARTYKGDDLKARVKSAAQQLKAQAQADLKAQAKVLARADRDVLTAIRAIHNIAAERYVAAAKEEWKQVRAQAQRERRQQVLQSIDSKIQQRRSRLAAADLAKITAARDAVAKALDGSDQSGVKQAMAALSSSWVGAACSSVSSRLQAADQQGAKVLSALKARTDQSAADVQQAIAAVSSFHGDVVRAQSICSAPPGTDALKQVRDALQTAQKAQQQAKQRVDAVKARTGK